MKVLLLPVGSSGDVYPFVGIGLELKRRGHDIVMITSGHFRKIAEASGFRFIETSSEDEFRAILNNEILWHPTKAFPYLAKHYILPLVPRIYGTVREHYTPGKTIAVSGSLAFGARLAQEKLGLPLAVVHLQPSMFRSVYAPPVYSGIGRLPGWMPVPLRAAVFRLLDVFIDRTLAGGLNQARSEIGLPPVNRILFRWWHSPQLTLGLFPDWFGQPQKDWPPSVRVTGFPLYDVTAGAPPDGWMPEDIREPIVFTAGSAMRVGHKFFEQSAGLCEKLGRPGLFVTAFPEQLPATLPPRIRHLPYAPFSQLFPRAAAVVHHGGVGTVAQALRAGVPQLIVPMSYDQPDNADRVERLGAGLSISPARYSSDGDLLLSRLLTEPEWTARCRAVAERFSGVDAIKESCDLIENTLCRAHGGLQSEARR